MRYSDQHIHSSCSFDSHTSMRDMVLAARERGMAAVTFTDHIDMDNEKTGENAPNYERRFPRCRETYAELMRDPPEGIEIYFGMELGEATHDSETARRAASEPGLDLILGSIHNLRHTMDFYWYPYSSEEECDRLNRLYLAELSELADWQGFDIMSHIGYTSRYTAKMGFKTRIDVEHYRDELAEIMEKLIAQGRGIELNVSGLYRNGTTYPEESGLRLYKDLGGEIITVGSDSHEAVDASKCISDGFELLKAAGFRYVAEFRKHKPFFTALD